MEKEINAQSGQGARATVRYSLTVFDRDNKRIRVGDGIQGAPLARRLETLIGEAAGLPVDTHQ